MPQHISTTPEHQQHPIIIYMIFSMNASKKDNRIQSNNNTYLYCNVVSQLVAKIHQLSEYGQTNVVDVYAEGGL